MGNLFIGDFLQINSLDVTKIGLDYSDLGWAFFKRLRNNPNSREHINLEENWNKMMFKENRKILHSNGQISKEDGQIDEVVVLSSSPGQEAIKQTLDWVKELDGEFKYSNEKYWSYRYL